MRRLQECTAQRRLGPRGLGTGNARAGELLPFDIANDPLQRLIDAAVSRFYRDAKIGAIYEGTSNMQLATIAKLVLGSLLLVVISFVLLVAISVDYLRRRRRA